MLWDFDERPYSGSLGRPGLDRFTRPEPRTPCSNQRLADEIDDLRSGPVFSLLGPGLHDLWFGNIPAQEQEIMGRQFFGKGQDRVLVIGGHAAHGDFRAVAVKRNRVSVFVNIIGPA